MTAFPAPLPAPAPPITSPSGSSASPHLVMPAPDSAAPVELVFAAGPWPADEAAAALQACLEQAALLQPQQLHGRRLWLRLARQQLGCRGLLGLEQTAGRVGLALAGVASAEATTLVAAAALGLETAPMLAGPWGEAIDASPAEAPLQVHQGTLRAGDQLEASGSLLVLGDVNPGASVRAGGHVLVWGRLRGVAHAGCRGDEEARIVALQLRPLQLRIAGCVARGPDAIPPAGLAEEARLAEGTIRIDPARPSWPLA